MKRLLNRFNKIDPATRRLAALYILIISFVLGHLNIGLYLFGLMSNSMMDAITNYLSWVAITITAADLVATTDVRKEQDSSGGGERE